MKTNPEFQPLESSNLQSALFDPDEKELYLQFHHKDRIYVYHDVPDYVWDQLKAAESKGKFFNGAIKGEYRCSELTQVE